MTADSIPSGLCHANAAFVQALEEVIELDQVQGLVLFKPGETLIQTENREIWKKFFFQKSIEFFFTTDQF